MSTLLLIDGHSQAYRAYFGMKTPLSTREGELTGAVFGFTRKLFSVLRDYQPDYVAVAFVQHPASHALLQGGSSAVPPFERNLR